MIKIILYTCLIIIAAIVSLLFYLDAFSTINIKNKEIGPYKLVYEEHKGPYNGIKEVQDKVYYSLLDDKIITTKGFGIYYDDPSKVAANKLRSIGGCIVNQNDYKTLDMLGNKYNVMDYYSPENIYAEFSFKNPLSILIGIFKVYPEIKKVQEKEHYAPQPVMEIYDVPAGKIIYSVPIKK